LLVFLSKMIFSSDTISSILFFSVGKLKEIINPAKSHPIKHNIIFICNAPAVHPITQNKIKSVVPTGSLPIISTLFLFKTAVPLKGNGV